MVIQESASLIVSRDIRRPRAERSTSTPCNCGRSGGILSSGFCVGDLLFRIALLYSFINVQR